MTRHHDTIIAKMPDLCCDDDCRHTNWGGKGRAHAVQSTCPMYQRELRKLQREDQWAFTDARKALPKNNLNAKIKYHEHVEQVIMPLEAFLAITKHFQQNSLYGLLRVEAVEGVHDGAPVYELPMMPYKEARDLSEISGARLMQRFDSGWMEA